MIEELASVILDKVADKCGMDEDDPPTGKLLEPRIYNRRTNPNTEKEDIGDELPFEHNVKKYKEFITERKGQPNP